MRVDGMLATILALSDESPAALAVKWRQLVDLLAQRFHTPDPGQAGQIEAYLREKRDEIDVATRKSVAAGLAGRLVSPAIVRLFAEEEAPVWAALAGGVRLQEEEWLELMPSLGEPLREALRRRSDLPGAVTNALAVRAVPTAPAADPANLAPARSGREPSAGPSAANQIQQLVDRIEQFRRGSEPQRNPEPPAVEPAESFRWETDADGVLVWVEGAPRGPLIGLSIAAIAETGEFGVDGQAAGAFDKKAPFRDARLTVAGSGPAAGEWRISGVPFFQSKHGSFLGYRGTARRPRLDEVARTDALGGKGGLFGTAVPAESLRNLIHELRTPLNAIVGFAEMIEGQYLGPAGSHYRQRARGIIEQADRLLAAVDDLDTAARVETSRLNLSDSTADAVALLSRLYRAFEEIARLRQAQIEIDIEEGLPSARVDPEAVERMFARLLGSSIGLLRPGESMSARLSRASPAGRPMLCLAIGRPKAIERLAEDVLLDPGYSPDGNGPGAPLLGLGFSLRLVRNLAEAVGGMLVLGESRMYLYLPVCQAEQSSQQGA